MRFALESMLDMIAEEIQMDPVDVRLLNAVQGNETTLDKKKVTSCGLSDCIREVVKSSDWKEKRRQTGSLRGVGLACYDYSSGFHTHYSHDSSSAHLTTKELCSSMICLILFSGISGKRVFKIS